MVKHSIKPFTLACLVEGPGFSFINVLVGSADQSPNGRQGSVDLQPIYMAIDISRSGSSQLLQVLLKLCQSPGLGYDSLPIAADHGYTAVKQVAQVIGQIRINSVNQGSAGEVAVLSKRHLPQEEVPDSIHPKLIGQLQGIYHIAFRFGHLIVLHQEPAVSKYRLRQRQVKGHKNDWPDDCMEPDDLLAD